MNRLFVNIKVDREERPDIDTIYMQAVQSLTGRGGWPMTVFLTDDGVPFYGGTYYPPEDRQGMPGFPRLLTRRLRGLQEQAPAARDLRARTADPDRLAGPTAGRRQPAHGVDPARRRGRHPGPPRRRPRRLRPRTQVPPGDDDRLPPALPPLIEEAAPARGRRDHAQGDGPRRHVRPGRRRLPPLLHRRRLARAPLREDALRQRPARPRLPRRLQGHRQPLLPPHRRGDPRLRAARDDRRRPAASTAAQDADSEGEEGKFFVWTPAELR